MTRSAVQRGEFSNRSVNPTNICVCLFTILQQRFISSSVFKVAISENINKEKKLVSCFTHMLHLCSKFNNDSAPPGDNIPDIHLNIMCMCGVHPGERWSLLMAASYCIHGDVEQQQDSSILYSATVIYSARQEHLRSLLHSR